MSLQQEIWAILASDTIDKIILERFLIKAIPQNRRIPYEQLERLTHLKVKQKHNLLESKLFKIHENCIEIAENEQLLTESANGYIKALIKKYVIPSRFTGCEELHGITGLFDEQNYTNAEKNFIDFIFQHFIGLADIELRPESALTLESKRVLFHFNLATNSRFCHFSKNVYNAILQGKLRAGDNLRWYIDKSYKNNYEQEIEERLKSSAEYDYFFDEKANLRCDLVTNQNTFVKKILNKVISELSDFAVKILLFVKLQNRFSILIRDKVFDTFD